MNPVKFVSFLKGEEFVRALVDAGLVPDETTQVIIHAEVGEIATMTYTTAADRKLLNIVGGIRPTDDADDAGMVR